jgi:ABC-type transport system involved in multi-copper enzyme maturation permease subunit
MIGTLKSEFQKLLTVRSTYVVFGLCVLLAVFFAFYVDGIKAGETVLDPGKMASEVTNAIATVSVIGSLVGVLLLTHEYRYGTIMYTLTASKSRTRVLLAKFFVVTVFSLVFSLVFMILSPLFAYIGLQIKGLELVPQVFPIWDMLWRALFAGWAFAMLTLIMATIIRSQVGAIAALFLVPTTVEGLFSLLLKENVIYLPFSAINSVLMGDSTKISHGQAALVVLTYIIVGWTISWQLFKRRDAN